MKHHIFRQISDLNPLLVEQARVFCNAPATPHCLEYFGTDTTRPNANNTSMIDLLRFIAEDLTSKHCKDNSGAETLPASALGVRISVLCNALSTLNQGHLSTLGAMELARAGETLTAAMDHYASEWSEVDRKLNTWQAAGDGEGVSDAVSLLSHPKAQQEYARLEKVHGDLPILVNAIKEAAVEILCTQKYVGSALSRANDNRSDGRHQAPAR